MITLSILIICELLVRSTTFEIIWNVPTQYCKKHKITRFPKLLSDANITYNANDLVKGDKIRILYHPGLWPSLENNITVNNGFPYKGDLKQHLSALQSDIEARIEKNFTGYAVIDMERFRPVFRQNTGWMIVYRNRTLEEMQKLYPKLKKHELFKKAEEIFEPAAKKFMLESIKLARGMWKNAKWGYYGYPYCFNSDKSNFTCPDLVLAENNRTDWLFSAYDYMYPSVYIFQRYTEAQNEALVVERTKEFNRIKSFTSNKNIKFYPYVWFYYNDGPKFLTERAFRMTLLALKRAGMDGAIIWGSSLGYQNSTFCEQFFNYTRDVIVPIVKQINQTIFKN